MYLKGVILYTSVFCTFHYSTHVNILYFSYSIHVSILYMSVFYTRQYSVLFSIQYTSVFNTRQFSMHFSISYTSIQYTLVFPKLQLSVQYQTYTGVFKTKNLNMFQWPSQIPDRTLTENLCQDLKIAVYLYSLSNYTKKNGQIKNIRQRSISQRSSYQLLIRGGGFLFLFHSKPFMRPHML